VKSQSKIYKLNPGYPGVGEDYSIEKVELSRKFSLAFLILVINNNLSRER
jgi:hypothetical protein